MTRYILTKREKECLYWVAKGKSSDEISELLCISANTVIFHLENAKRKLQAKTRCHAVSIAYQYGILC